MDLSQLLVQVIPLSFLAAVSPVSLSIFLILMTFTKDRRLAGLSFFIGSVIMLLIVVFLGMVLGQSLVSSGHTDNSTKAIIDLFLGAILILLGIRSLFKENHESRIIQRLKEGEEAVSRSKEIEKYLVIGFFTFLVNFSTAIFVLDVGKVIGLAGASLLSNIIAIVIMLLITMILIELPLLFILFMPKTADKFLDPLEKWIKKNGSYIITIFLIAIGAYVMYNASVVLGLL